MELEIAHVEHNGFVCVPCVTNGAPHCFGNAGACRTHWILNAKDTCTGNDAYFCPSYWLSERRNKTLL